MIWHKDETIGEHISIVCRELVQSWLDFSKELEVGKSSKRS